jgi:hypothetical protein
VQQPAKYFTRKLRSDQNGKRKRHAQYSRRATVLSIATSTLATITRKPDV